MRRENSARDVLTSLGRLGGGDGRRNGVGKGADEENKLPSLLFGEFLSVRRHGFVALRDDVEEFAVCNGGQMWGVGQHSGTRIVHFGLRAISLPCLAVTFGTFVEVDGEDLFCGDGWLERERILDEPGFRWDRPGVADEGDVGEVGSECEKNHEQDSGGARGFRLLGSGHDLCSLW